MGKFVIEFFLFLDMLI